MAREISRPILPTAILVHEANKTWDKGMGTMDSKNGYLSRIELYTAKKGNDFE